MGREKKKNIKIDVEEYRKKYLQHSRKKEKGQMRLALTLLYALVIFITLVITVVLAGVLVSVLAHFGIVANSGDHLSDSTTLIWIMVAICIILGAVIALVSSTISLIPHKRTIAELRNLARGDFKTRLNFGFPINKHITFSKLSESFNILAEELENTEMLRSDFVNNFSHEFKTPIVSIAGFAKLLKRGNLTEEQRKEYIDIIEEESLRLSYMATNVLNLTKVENQTILTDVSSYNLSEQIRGCVLLLEHQWSRKNLEFHLDFEEHMIAANEELMKQVWINLIDNAIKFSQEYGVIQIKIKEEEGFYQVSVANAGKEIPEELQEKIFRRFYQADESHSSEGNGVGLAIVKRIAQLHMGEVMVSSEHGITTFTVHVPIIAHIA